MNRTTVTSRPTYLAEVEAEMMGEKMGGGKNSRWIEVRSEVCFAAKNFSTSEETSSEGDGGKNLKRTQYNTRQGQGKARSHSYGQRCKRSLPPTLADHPR
jgi:hypothetical protein